VICDVSKKEAPALPGLFSKAKVRYPQTRCRVQSKRLLYRLSTDRRRPSLMRNGHAGAVQIRYEEVDGPGSVAVQGPS
jgi:hypothetical protein